MSAPRTTPPASGAPPPAAPGMRRLAWRAGLALAATAAAALYLARAFDEAPPAAPDGLLEDPFIQHEAVARDLGLAPPPVPAPGAAGAAAPAPAPLDTAPSTERVAPQCLDYLGTLEYDIFGKVFGRTVEVKPVGVATFHFTEQQDATRGTWYDLRFDIAISDRLVALFTFRSVAMHCQARLRFDAEGATMEPIRYVYQVTPVWRAGWRKEVLYFLDQGFVTEQTDGTWQKTAVSRDCYDPVSHIVNTMNRTFEQFERGADEEGRFRLGSIYVEREQDHRRIEEPQWATVHPAERRVKLVFSERAFPGGGNLVFTFAPRAGALVVDNTQVEIEYGPAGGVLTQRVGRSSRE